MYELTIIYKTLDKKSRVIMFDYVGYNALWEGMGKEVAIIGIQNIIHVSFRPVSIA